MPPASTPHNVKSADKKPRFDKGGVKERLTRWLTRISQRPTAWAARLVDGGETLTDPNQHFRVALAVHVFLQRGDEILMLRRANTGYADGLLSVPAGHLDGDESVLAAALRETAEEVGVALAPADVRVVGVMHRREEEERVDFFVATTRWAGEIANREPHKCAGLLWAPLASPPPDTVPYVRQALAAYRQGEWFSTFGWA